MDDDNGLELSLGLSFGGPSNKQKGKSSSSDVRTEDSDSGSKIVSDFKNFLNAGIPRHESRPATPSDSGKPPENFFNDLSRAPSDAAVSVNFNGKNIWTSGNYRTAESDDVKGLENSHKRRILLDETNNQKRHEKESHGDNQERNKTPIISITTEEGSTADNEDVADSEIEGSTSRVVSHHDRSRRSTPEFPQEIHGFPEGRGLDLQVHKSLNNSSKNELKLGKSGFNVPFSAHSMNMTNGSHQVYGKESSNPGASIMSGNPLPGLMMQAMNASNSERLEAQPVIPANSPLMFGYSPVQLPTLDRDNSWGFTSHAQHIHPPFTSRVSQTSDRRGDALPQAQGLPRSLSELTPRDSRLLEQPRNNGKHGLEEGSSSQNEEITPGSSRGKDLASDRSTAEDLFLDFSAIKPGIAADLKFGGCGSCPNLPWVSTTTPGPNGRTISGVTYRYSPNQIKIVCACHGSHMSPEEFIRHAAEENANPENSSSLSTVPSKKPATSAQS